MELGRLEYEEKDKPMQKPKHGRTKLEKGLIIMFFITVVVFLALFLVYYLKEEDDDDKKLEPKRCNTVDCLVTASSVGQSLDQAVDPCEDFYQFACGRWIDRHPTTPTKQSITIAAQVNDDMMKNMRDLLEAKDPTALDAFQKVRAFYSSCLNTHALDAKGPAPLLDFLKTGGSNLFPTLEPNWVDVNMTLNQILNRVRRVGNLGTSPIIVGSVTLNLTDSTRRSIVFSQPELPIARSYYLGSKNSPLMGLYQKLYVDLMTLLGADPVTAAKDAQELVDFEIQMANATLTKAEKSDFSKIHKSITLRQLSEIYPQFDWLEYLQKEYSLVGINITMDNSVIVITVSYFDKIFDILSSTSKRAVLNHCLWVFVKKYAKVLDKKFRDTNTKFFEAAQGISAKSERWKKCVSKTVETFPDISGRLYADRHFPSTAKAKMDTMIDNLKEAFREMILEADWMTSRTKSAALEKLDAMVDMVGYPESIMNDTAVSGETKSLNISEGEYFTNLVNIDGRNRLMALRLLPKPVNKKEWAFSAATVNAFYQPMSNSIFFPAGILQNPAFSETYMDAMNYGAIGHIIGHEMTHGFDTTGGQFDKIGNLRMWWQAEDLQKFQARTQCMIEQYNNFVDPVLNKSVDGKLTLNENIADNGGIKEAYRAYHKLIARRQKEEPRLPALDYTPDQLFFISTAQWWCSTLSKKFRLLLKQQDVHSPARFRVIGILQNSEDFARVFHCKEGSYMNPEKKCHVW